MCEDIERKLQQIKVDILALCKRHVIGSCSDDFELALLLDEAIQISCDEFSLEFKGEEGKTPLLFAARNNKTKCVSVLLKYGADIRARDDAGNTSLHEASLSGGCGVLVSLLLRHGAYINARTICGATPLMLASRNGDIDCVRRLLQSGADVSSTNYNDVTALHGASVEVALLLLDYGANLEAKDIYGKTPLMDSCANGDVACSIFLLDNGANVNARDHFDWTPLMCASYLGNLECVDILLRRGADIHAVNVHGEAATTVAANDMIQSRLSRYRKLQANWCVLAPLLKCSDIHSDSVFSQSIDSMLPNIRRYAGYDEDTSASCVPFLATSYAKTVMHE